MGPGQVPGQGVGQVDASEVNAVARWLSDLVLENDLPDKMLIVHQFQTRMVTNRHLLETHPGLLHIIHMDGFGPQYLKLQTYSYVHAVPPFYNGFKLFYDEDTRHLRAPRTAPDRPGPRPNHLSVIQYPGFKHSEIAAASPQNAKTDFLFAPEAAGEEKNNREDF